LSSVKYLKTENARRTVHTHPPGASMQGNPYRIPETIPHEGIPLWLPSVVATNQPRTQAYYHPPREYEHVPAIAPVHPPAAHASMPDSTIPSVQQTHSGVGKSDSNPTTLKAVHTLREHSESSEESSLCCEDCGLKFTRASSLTRHVETVHSNKRSFKCPVCHRTFGRFSNLERHIQVRHRGIKQFECETCGWKFAQSTDLKKHIRRKHADVAVATGLLPVTESPPNATKSGDMSQSGSGTGAEPKPLTTMPYTSDAVSLDGKQVVAATLGEAADGKEVFKTTVIVGEQSNR
jgi:uncharacterized C2H2 Zn-finger protein